MESFDACIIGGGPAGSASALRLARLGHRVCLVERERSARWYACQSLSEGVLPILCLLGVQSCPGRDAGLQQSNAAIILWDKPIPSYITGPQRGASCTVDRHSFDDALLDNCSAAGVRLYRPGRVDKIRHTSSGYHLEILAHCGRDTIHSKHLVDAAGRSRFVPGRIARIGAPTLAISAIFSSPHVPESRIEASNQYWTWGTPLSDGRYCAILFLDPRAHGLKRELLEDFLRAQLARTVLFRGLSGSKLTHALVCCDASAIAAADAIGTNYIRAGESLVALDPLSSCGVESALRFGFLSGTVVHTMLIARDRAELARRFYRARQTEEVSAHVAFTGAFYGKVRRYAHLDFWKSRLIRTNDPHSDSKAENSVLATLSRNTKVQVSENVDFVDEPCIIGDEIRSASAVHHPSLGRPIAFIDGIPIRSLLTNITGFSLGLLIKRWSNGLSDEKAERIASWFLKNQILIPIRD